MNTKKTTKKIGDHFESIAVDWLRKNSFKIIEQNYHAKKLGEIDIIAIKDDVYHFVEVKSGKDFEAIYNITPQKLYKLFRSIDYYLKEKNLDVDYCVDAIVFNNNSMEYLENITL
jgi:putative endonuclease